MFAEVQVAALCEIGCAGSLKLFKCIIAYRFLHSITKSSIKILSEHEGLFNERSEQL